MADAFNRSTLADWGIGVSTPAPAKPTTTPTPVPTPAPVAPASNTIVYFKDGSSNIIPTSDLKYWENQGWSTTKSTTPVVNAQPVTTISDVDKKWINDLYNKYFDRTATSAELENWVKGNPASLEQFLAKEQKTYGYVSKAAGANNKARYDAAMAEIDASTLPPDIKSLWKQVVGMYPSATDFNTKEIMDTFNKIKTATIDPYYKELADVAIKDIQTSVNQTNKARQLELEAENVNAQDAINKTKGNLESIGMTFSGKGVEQLGTGSAYAASPTAETPISTPFAGIELSKLQGTVGQANRLISTSTAAKYAADQQKIGRTGEDILGKNEMSGISGLSYTPAGVNLSGSNAIAKETKTASILQDLITQWRTKQQNAQNT